MKKIYVITSSLSDIGKGWLTSCFGSLLSNSKIIKVDPVIKRLTQCDVCNDLTKVSSDYINYIKLKNDFSYESIIRGGEVLYDFLMSHSYNATNYDLNDSFRFNMNDVASYFSKKLSSFDLRNIDNLIVEVGGSVYDEGNFYITEGLRRFAFTNSYELKIILLSFLLPSEDSIDRVKTSIVKDGISKVVGIYKKNPDIVLVRSHLLKKITSSDVNLSLDKISSTMLIDRACIIHEPTFKDIFELKVFLKQNIKSIESRITF